MRLGTRFEKTGDILRSVDQPESDLIQNIKVQNKKKTKKA